MKPAKRLFTESPYNFPDQQDYENFLGMSQKPRFPSATSRENFPSQFAIGDKVKFRIGPTAEVDAVIYAARFEAATVWYDLIFDPYVGTPDQGGYTILTNVRSLMIHPSEFQERVKRITFKEAKDIKLKLQQKLFQERIEPIPPFFMLDIIRTDPRELQITLDPHITFFRMKSNIEQFIAEYNAKMGNPIVKHSFQGKYNKRLDLLFSYSDEVDQFIEYLGLKNVIEV